MKIIESASLYLRPSIRKDGVLAAQKPLNANGQFAVTRDGAGGASIGTEIDANGLIVKGRTNYFLNSAALSTQSVTTVTNRIYAVSFIGTGTITFSGGATGSLVGTGASDRVQTFFVASTTSVTCTVTGTVEQAQFEDGQVFTEYVPTTGAIGFGGLLGNTPRFDKSSGCDVLIAEPSRTNLIRYSELIDPTISGIFWFQVGTNTFTRNYGIAPDGKQTSTRVQFGAATSASQLFAFFNSSATAYTGSLWFKGTGTLKFGFFDNTNVLTDTITLTGDWQRFDVTKTLLATTNARFWVYPEGAGATTDFEVWGAQVEAGSSPTSYIPTYGTAANRGADNVTLTGASALIGQTQGTIMAEVYHKIGTTNIGVWCRNSAGGNYGEFIRIGTTNTNKAYCEIATGSVQQVGFTGTADLNEGLNKLAVTYDSNNVKVYVNGQLLHTDTSASIPACNQIYLGNYVDNAPRKGDKGLVYLNKSALTPSEAIALTTI